MGTLHALLPGLREGRALDPGEAAAAAAALLAPGTADDDRAAFLLALAAKGETAGELAAFARAFLPLAVPIPAPRLPGNGPLLDCCGTGGGGLPLFNVSTAIVFILAAAGVPVAKHGNRGVTKPSGSADVFEALGLKAELAPGEVAESLSELGLAFLFAPAFHPAFKAVGPVRKRLAAEGKRTLFNLLGPLLNPLRPGAQLVGVFRREQVGLYHEALRDLGCARPAVVYGETFFYGPGGTAYGGTVYGEGRIAGQPQSLPLGEVSPLGDNFCAGIDDGGAIAARFAGRVGDRPFESCFVRDAGESAERIAGLLRPQPVDADANLGLALLIANAGVAFAVQGRTATVAEGLVLAEETLRNGAAAAKLEQARAWARGR